MFVFEILIYVFFAWIMYSLANKSIRKFTNYYDIDLYLWMYIIFYTFICAIRWKVGVDSLDYAKYFIYGRQIHGDNNESEWLFNEFVNFISYNGIHYTIGMGICAFLQIFPLIKVLQNDKAILRYLPIVLFGSMYFLSLNNGVRQSIVACWFVYSTKWIVNRCWCKYFLFIYIAHLIHSSSLILAPLYFLGYIQKLEKLIEYKWICVGLLFTSLIIGLNPSFQNHVGRFDNIMSMLGYEGYTDRVTDALLGINDNKQAFGIQKLSYFLSFLSFSFFGKELNEKYFTDKPLLRLWWFLGFAYGCLYHLLCGMSYIFHRPLMYLEYFSMIMIACVIHCLLRLHGFSSKVKQKYLAVILIIVMWSSICWNLYKSLNQPDPQMEYTAYKTILFHDIN